MCGQSTTMNVFEDLIVELKEENLLEETIPLPSKTNGNGTVSVDAAFLSQDANGSGNGNGNGNGVRGHIKRERAETNLSDQVSGLQFVEFVVGASERHAGLSGLPFDELQVQKALHRYNQSSSEPESSGFSEAESALIESLRSWEDDLVKRDQSLTVESLRQFAETANPPLSPQTLFALVRFYRSLPVSENSYLKFDFVVTRLFSKFVDGDRREMLCSRSEVVKHLDQRYSAWGMNAFKSLPADDPDIALVCLSFDDFAAEVDNASRLSDLASAKLFERLYEFKRGTGAMLFIPQVTAALIDTNLKISSKLVDLVELENKRGGQLRVGDIEVDLISKAIGRTFELELESDGEEEIDSSFSSGPIKVDARTPRAPKTKRSKEKGGRKSSLFGVNKWLLLATIVTVVASLGLYIWSEYYSTETVPTSTVRKVDIHNPELAKFVKTAKVSNDMLHAVVNSGFTELSADKKREVVQQMRDLGSENGYKRVTLYDDQGRTLAYAAADRVDIK